MRVQFARQMWSFSLFILMNPGRQFWSTQMAPRKLIKYDKELISEDSLQKVHKMMCSLIGSQG